MRLLGLDPGLRHTGWGVIEAAGNRLSHVADGVVHSDGKEPLAERLVALFRQLGEIIDRYRPDEAAIEETFVNKNPSSTLKLGVARGVVLLAPAERGIPCAEYSANLVKKSVVGAGHAEKAQVQMMVRRLLPGCTLASPDAADALAVAICHAHHSATRRAWKAGALPPQPLSPRGEGGAGAQAREGEGLRAPTRPGADAPAPSPRPSSRRGEGGGGSLRELATQYPTAAETARARRLRRDATELEKRLWQRLRACQLDGAKFRRQEPILGFTVDFVCHERRLVVELDGGQHASTVNADDRRTSLLNQAGFRVLRFRNSDVVDNVEGVLEAIKRAIAATNEGAP
ncbi:MAG TPA: crossover junction endodeoxyribonuclease RuvC [Stellaceae bacterium]|nr:crossover junction endodeoxyribonuclease RuvC [Stellaceae bacterium]